MLALAFFVSVFSTVTWLIYAFLFVSEKLSGIPLNALSLFDASIYADLSDATLSCACATICLSLKIFLRSCWATVFLRNSLLCV